MSNNLYTPILFLTFNRFDETKRVFEVIKNARPKKLYIASDGPRNSSLGEDLKVKNVRDFIESNINWECDVKTLFREKNLGCKIAVSSAIDWFFENEDRGIILEDDCLPNISFFEFCEELLEKYQENNNIAMISGDNFHFGHRYGEADYFFSRIPHIWGWATWKRAWKSYDVEMSDYQDFKNKEKIKDIWQEKKINKYWISIFDDVYKNKINTWDYQLALMIFNRNLVCICPNVNLVSNIGFGNKSTHIVKKNKYIGIPGETINFPLKHPKEIVLSAQADLNIINEWFLKGYRFKKILKKIGLFNLVKKIYSKFN